MSSSRTNAFLTGTAAEVIPMIKVDGRDDRERKAGRDHQRA